MKQARITALGKATIAWIDSQGQNTTHATREAFQAGWHARDEEVEELNLLLHNNQARREEVEMRHGDLLAENERLREQLRPTHTPTCACQLCLDAYGPVEARSS